VDIDKFEHFALMAQPAEQVKAPFIAKVPRQLRM
jgi:hypothetical protein